MADSVAVTAVRASKWRRGVRTLLHTIIYSVAIGYTLYCGWDYLMGNRAINFYGRLIDKEGNPVSDTIVTVKIAYRHLVPPIVMCDLGDPEITRYLTTDANGNFSDEGEDGYAVFVSQVFQMGHFFFGSSKPGRLGGAFYYHPLIQLQPQFTADKEHPVVFVADF